MHDYPDGAAVTEAKMIGFMKDIVLPRASSQRNKGANNQVDGAQAIIATHGQLSWSSIKQYRSAIVNLWKDQASKGENQLPHAVPALLDLLKPFRPRHQKPQALPSSRKNCRLSMSLPNDAAPVIAADRVPAPTTMPLAAEHGTMSAIPNDSSATSGLSALPGLSSGQSTPRTLDPSTRRPSSTPPYNHQHARSHDLSAGQGYPQLAVESTVRRVSGGNISQFSDDSYLGRDSFQESIMNELNNMREEQRALRLRQDRLTNLVHKEFATLRSKLDDATHGRVQFVSPTSPNDDNNDADSSASAGNIDTTATGSATPAATPGTVSSPPNGRYMSLAPLHTTPKPDTPFRGVSPAVTPTSTSFPAAGARSGPMTLFGPSAQSQSPAPAGERMPLYRLSRSIRRVPDLWREWTVGLTGHPSVEALDTMYGASWRASSPERMFYSRRKAIIDAIKDIVKRRSLVEGQPGGYGHMTGREDVASAVQHLEEMRMRRKMSLDALSKVLMRARQKKKRKGTVGLDGDVEMDEDDVAAERILEEEGILAD